MGREAGYTTILKLLQIMTEKRLVVRDESARTHIYEAAYTEDQTQRQLVTDLLDRVVRRLGRQARAAGARRRARRRRKSSPKSGSCSTTNDGGRDDAILQTAGWTLIHFVWQGRGDRRRRGRRCCGSPSGVRRTCATSIACVGLGAMLAAPVVTARLLWTSSRPHGERVSTVAADDSAAADARSASVSRRRTPRLATTPARLARSAAVS